MSELVVQPDLAFLVKQVIRIALSQTNAHAIGVIQSVDFSKRSATATLVYKQIVNGAPKDYPVLVDCPLLIAQGGGGQLTFPIAANNTCFVFFNDVNMSRFIASGNQGAQPIDTRAHAFADALIFVGLDDFVSAQNKDYFEDGVELSFADESGSSALQLTDTIKLQNAVTDLKTVVDGLIDLIAAITVTCPPTGGPSSVPINAASIEGYKTTVAGLLT